MSNKVPQIRFNGYSDAWVQRKLVDITTKIGSGKTPKGGSEVYQSNGIALLRSQNVTNDHVDMTDVAFISEEINNTMLGSEVQHNDVLLNITGASIGRSAVYKHTETANVNQHVSIIRLTQGFDPDFVQQLISSFQGQNQIQAFQAGGAREGLNFKQIGLMTFAFPSYDEQLKVSSVVSRLSDLIAANQRKLDLLKEQKKGYLQKMFPKNGTKVPELRFEGFADDWEERKLSSGLREYTDRVIVEDDKEYSQISVRNNFGGITLRGSKMGNKIGRKRQAKINLTKYPQTLIFTRQTVEQGGIGWVDKYCDGAIVTENMPTISLDTSVFSKYFLTNLFQTRIFYKNAILDNVEGGSAQIAIHESKFLSSTLLFPNLDEQEKIGEFFKQLDKTIALHQRKLDLLKEQKKGFLQKMFV